MPSPPPVDLPFIDSQSVARAYDRWSVQYDSDPNATRDLDAIVLRRAPLSFAGLRVLELGCGTGKNSVWLAAQAKTLLALDFSAGMLTLARTRVTAANTSFLQHDIRGEWPVASGDVDAVVANLVLEHISELEHVYAEAARVLRSGGHLFVSELHPYRQLGGAQARFTDKATQQTVPVKSYLHTTGEYVNAGIAAGFVLRELGEWLEPDAKVEARPRLLTLLFQRP